MSRVRIMVIAGVVVLSTFVGPSALAASSGGESAAALEEIVVTAQKRTEDINTVPISISALTDKKLDEAGVKNVQDLARLVPGLNIRPDGVSDDLNVSIRGIDSTVGSATTSVYINETPVQARHVCFYCGLSAFPEVFDLERVEVLRGPQGTLFGAGSEGGTVRFITPAPSLTAYSGYARADWAYTQDGAGSWEIGAAGGGPLVDNKVGFRASAWTRTSGGYIDEVSYPTGALLRKNANQTRSSVGRLALTFAPTDRLTITPSVHVQKTEKSGRSLYWESAGPLQAYAWIPSPADDRQILGSLDIQYDGSAVTAKSITSYYDRLQDRIDDYTAVYAAIYQGGPITIPGLPNWTAASILRTTQANWTQEFRLSSKDSSARLGWVAGLYYAHNRVAFAQYIQDDINALTLAAYGAPAVAIFGVPPIGPNGEYSYVEHTGNLEREIATFGELSVRFSDSWKLALGMRGASSKVEYDLRQEGPEAYGLVTNRGEQKESPVTPKASLSYQHDQKLVYGTVAKGYRVGGANQSLAIYSFCTPDLASLGIADAPKSYSSDSVWSYEVGAKGRYLNNRAQLSGSLFWVNWHDIQTNVLLNCGYSYTANAGNAVSRGADIQGEILIGTGLTLSAAVGYTDAYYTQDVRPGGQGVIAKNGESLPTPPVTGTAAVRYEWSITEGMPYVRGEYQYAASFDRLTQGVSGYNANNATVDGIHTAALRIGFTAPRYDVSLYVNNVFNSQPKILRELLQGSGEYQDATLRPRTIGVSGKWQF